MKQLCELPKTVIECDCGQELIHLVFEEDEDNIVGQDDLRFLYVSFYRTANSSRGWIIKLKHIWRIIKNGSPWEDMVTLRKCERLKLTEYLNSLPH